MLLSAGERISMALLSMAIRELGGDAISFTGSQSGIITNDRHVDARIIEVRPFRVQDELARGTIVVIAGYQGVSYRREVTTLGRGGSDTTAVAMAAALDAEYCEICSDVDGVYSADPRVVPAAQRIGTLSYEETQEMAEAGAKVLNAQAVEFAKDKGIAIYARATQGPLPGADPSADGTVVRRQPAAHARHRGRRGERARRARARWRRARPPTLLAAARRARRRRQAAARLRRPHARVVISRENLHDEARAAQRAAGAGCRVGRACWTASPRSASSAPASTPPTPTSAAGARCADGGRHRVRAASPPRRSASPGWCPATACTTRCAPCTSASSKAARFCCRSARGSANGRRPYDRHHADDILAPRPRRRARRRRGPCGLPRSIDNGQRLHPDDGSGVPGRRQRIGAASRQRRAASVVRPVHLHHARHRSDVGARLRGLSSPPSPASRSGRRRSTPPAPRPTSCGSSPSSRTR